MTIIIEDQNFADFQAWSGATATHQQICDAGKAREFEAIIEDLYPDGLTGTTLNDLLWHDSDWCLEQVGLNEEEEEEEEEEEKALKRERL